VEEENIHIGRSGLYVRAVVMITGGTMSKVNRCQHIHYRYQAQPSRVKQKILRLLQALVRKGLLELGTSKKPIDVTIQPIAYTPIPN
jgi:hypothetical protein